MMPCSDVFWVFLPASCCHCETFSYACFIYNCCSLPSASYTCLLHSGMRTHIVNIHAVIPTMVLHPNTKAMVYRACILPSCSKKYCPLLNGDFCFSCSDFYTCRKRVIHPTNGSKHSPCEGVHVYVCVTMWGWE